MRPHRASRVSRFCCALALLTAARLGAQPYPVLYTTDLYYTISDIDDHFDAAVLLKTPELDVKGIVLDNHAFPTDGEKVLEKLFEYTGRRVPVVKGAGGFTLRSLTDKGFGVPHEEGVEFLLDTLRKSPDKVALIAVGSMTDVTLAYLREPKLLADKVSAVYVVAGSAESPEQDWNVKLDPFAFVALMRSPLPIVWVPVDSSMWYYPAPKLLVPPKNRLSHFLLQELLYWYLRDDFRGNQHKDRYEYYEEGRWMWSTPGLVQAMHHPEAAKMFDLSPCTVEFDDRGVMKTVQFDTPGSHIQVVRRVNAGPLNQFITRQIER